MLELVEQSAESDSETSVRLRELISRPGQHHATSISAAATSEENADHDNPRESTLSTTVGSSLDPGRSVPADQASIRTNTTSFSIRSIRSITPSFADELFSSRAYKRYRNRGPNSETASVFSKDSTATKGDRLPTLSDISSGNLSTSEHNSTFLLTILQWYVLLSHGTKAELNGYANTPITM